MSSSGLLHSTATACFNLLASLSSSSSSSSLPNSTIKLKALLTVLQQRDTPFYSFMTNQCEVSLISLCRQFVPPNNEGDSVDISIKEVEVMFRILSSAASTSKKASSSFIVRNHQSIEDKVYELLRITITAAVADVALELARDVKQLTSSFSSPQRNHYQQQSPPSNSNVITSSTTINNDHQNTSSSFVLSSMVVNNNNNQSQNTSTTFDVDLDFVQKVSNHVEVFGSAMTVQKIIKVLEAEKRGEPLGRESVNIWNYAFDTRQGFGGMNEDTRQDLIGAALEVTGRELYPAIASTHVAAELVFRKIVDCI